MKPRLQVQFPFKLPFPRSRAIDNPPRPAENTNWQSAIDSRDLEKIEKALADYNRIVGGYANMVPCDLGFVAKAKAVRFALIEWERVATGQGPLANSVIPSPPHFPMSPYPTPPLPFVSTARIP